jgi:tRNA-Thr(GGU) m(6)t(6)A37 methyltransferase TsaA
MDSYNISPIAYFNGNSIQNFEAPRQASLSQEEDSYIELTDLVGLESIKDLGEFSHIWLIYIFHKNQKWKNLVLPPRGKQKRGVFATRSNYRPNFIGMSCVELRKVDGNIIYIGGSDLLDGTPIVDIKPYLGYSDSFPDAQLGWTADIQKFKVLFESDLDDQIEKCHGLMDQLNIKKVDFKNILEQQLSYEPTDSQRKRVKKVEKFFEFAIRTYRFLFSVDWDSSRIFVLKMYSGYTKEDLNCKEDPYADKKLHRNLFS